MIASRQGVGSSYAASALPQRAPTLGERVVIGAEASYWTAGKGNENCTGLSNRNSICHKAFEEIGAAFRVGYPVTPSVLVFGKGSYVNRDQRKRIEGLTGQQPYDHYKADGYQLGGGAELTLTQGRAPFYANAQYVYSNYHDHSSAQRVMGGVGIRFKSASNVSALQLLERNFTCTKQP